MPAYKLNVTKQGQYQTFKHADKTLVQSEWIRKQETSKIDSVRAALRQELEDLGCATDGPDLRKLRVYQHTFDKIIAEFKQYGPVLAEIKNENRLLLRFERKKSVRMEAIIAQLKKENEFLASELKRKLALYASYLPPTVLSEKRRDDELLAEVEHMIPKHAAGDDPITLYEKKINALEEEGSAMASRIEQLQRSQEEDFVPKAIHDQVATNRSELSNKYSELKQLHTKLEEELVAKGALVTKLEAALREKEEQYHFLIAEYTGLQEALAKKSE
ncbi:hypothetical protein HDU84_000640 [Entophlyctis sp. JEL0112]|nr:hypothetical protein HDU84_000640 [Entophlyctis sp. JEL0112]